jgi:hypothetical protein
MTYDLTHTFGTVDKALMTPYVWLVLGRNCQMPRAPTATEAAGRHDRRGNMVARLAASTEPRFGRTRSGAALAHAAPKAFATIAQQDRKQAVAAHWD